jgi:hypothetical protein
VKERFLLLLTLFSSWQLMANTITWSQPVVLSGPTSTVSNPQIVMDGSGNATAAWIENGFVNASFQPVNGTWGTVATLSATALASTPQLKVDGSGNTTAVWSENGVVMASTLPLNGSWSSPTAVSATGASNPALAVDATGNMVAVWIRSTFIESSTKLFGGSWNNVSVLSAANSDNPDVAIGANGTVCAVWHSVVSGANNVLSATNTIGGVWNSPLTIATGGFNHNYPHIVVDSNGNSTVVWFRYELSGANFNSVQVATSSLALNGTSWSVVPTFLSGLGSQNPANLSLKLVVDSSGDLLALWSQSYDGTTFNIEVAQQLEGGSWSGVTQLVGLDLYSFQGDVVSNPLGTALAGYMYFDGSNIVVQATEASMTGITNNLFFSAPINVSTGSENGYPKVATAFAGNTVYGGAIWLSSNGINTTIQAATGSRSSILPPTSLSVVQNANQFGVFTEYANTLSWQSSSSPNIDLYVIYRNGVKVAAVGSNATQYIDHNMIQNGSVTYGILAFDEEISQSPTATVSFP